MDFDTVQSHLQSLGEWVIDEDKTVTYKWLSKVLKIHVNTAKQLLFAYLTEQKKKSLCKITATHLLAGELLDGSKQVSIVNEEDLVSARNNFKEITSEHIYSIQKNHYLKNLQLLYAVNKSIQDPESFVNPIKCSKSILKIKNFNSVESLKESFSSYVAPGRDLNVGIKKGNAELKEDRETVKKGDSPKKENGMAEKESSKTKAQPGKKNSIGKDRNIANFFNNSAGSTKRLKSLADAKKKNEENDNSKKMGSSCVEDTGKIIQATADHEMGKAELKSNVSKPNSRSKKQKTVTKSEESEGKKRKRIKVFSDSEESNEESFEEKIPSPAKSDGDVPEEDIESKMQNVELEDEPSPQNKRKKRKIVDKLVVDEDGFMETKKEVVYETDSENDDEHELLKEGKDPPKRCSPRKKTKTVNENPKTKLTSSTSAQQKKQSSLYSFFKKN